ncbi:hypothetical protein [Kitasatospora fiedleri]|uniref:hypothetical protein n=1 Tax=Kitasatospora fiedleri TaxID=2991545 RepID=UPI00249C1614|nr:hypothetical protein [Kitasatospora fiedleri]
MTAQPERPDLDTIQARTDAATDGPWYADHVNDVVYDFDGRFVAQTVLMNGPNPDAIFTAHARTDVPELIAYARHLETRVAELEQDLAGEQARLADRALEARELRAECSRAATLLSRDPDGARVLLDRLATGAPVPARDGR